ncbi:MAG: hypothetical protein FDZ70_08235, partial [Actinobacteria bacterium]
MTGIWLLGIAAGLALMVWDQARFRRFYRRAASASPQRARMLARRRFAESGAAALATAAVALGVYVALPAPAPGRFGPFGLLTAGAVATWVAVSWT